MNELTLEMIEEAIVSKKVRDLRKYFEEYNSVDIAELINELSVDKLLFIFKTVPSEWSAEVFTYLNSEVQETLIKTFSGSDIENLIEELYSDELVDFIEELPANLVRKVLRYIDKDTRKDINRILNYPEDSAGSLITIEYLELKKSMTVGAALERIRERGQDVDDISYAYIVDKTRTIAGYIELKTLILSSPEKVLEDLMERDIVSVRVDDDRATVVETFKHYDMNMIPVVNKDDKMIGVITADDIMDVIEEEATEDIQMMSGSAPLDDNYLETGVFSMVKKRIVWLLILMLSGVFTSIIIDKSEVVLATLPALAIFMPMLNGTAGNAGNQAIGLVVRGISLNSILPRDWLRVLWKEVRVAFVLGFIMSLCCFGWLWLENALHLINCDDTSIYFVASVSMFISIFIAKSIGSGLPILAKVCKLDPAIMSGPLVTTIVDASTVALYYGLARLFLM